MSELSSDIGVNLAARAKRARRLQNTADQITDFRENHSDKLGVVIGATKRNWYTTAAAGAIAAGDFVDGYLAKKAQKILGVDKSLTGGDLRDPHADKTFRKALQTGIKMRAIREGDAKTVAFIEAKETVDKWRDGNMAEDRRIAQERTTVKVGALLINRVKTVLELTGEVILISPLAENERVKDLSLGIMAVGTGLGIAGQRHYHNMVQSALAETAETQAQECPHELDN
jgi:hypothetical protein